MMEEVRTGDESFSGTAGAERSPLKTKLETLGDYRIIREIGRGGMGVVYEAEQLSLGRRVALKVLPFHSRLNAAALERFQLEARASARLEHPNLVPGFFGATGLHWAAINGHRSTVDLLLARGASLTLRDARFNATPEGWAREGGHLEIAEALQVRGNTA